MKNLNKKISAVVLAGMIVVGGFASSGLRVHADEISKEDKEKYEQENYNVDLPNLEEKNKFPQLGLLGYDDNKAIEEVKKAINQYKDKDFYCIQLSSDFSRFYGDGRGINGYLEGLQQDVQNSLKEAQAFFYNVDEFNDYMKKYSDKIAPGIHRIQVGHVDVLFRSGRPSWAGH